jgi:hypothetical protein
MKGKQQNAESPQNTSPRQLTTAQCGMVTIPLDTVEQIHSKFANIAIRRKLFVQADAVYCGEIFRLLAALIDWEQIAVVYVPFLSFTKSTHKYVCRERVAV